MKPAKKRTRRKPSPKRPKRRPGGGSGPPARKTGGAGGGFDPDAAALPGSGLYGLTASPEESRVVVVPVPFEATTSYGGGTSRGPEAILRASRQVDLFDRQTGRPWEAGIAMLPIPRRIRDLDREARRRAAPVIRKGGVVGNDRRLKAAVARVDAIGEAVNAWVHERTRELLDRDRLPMIVGGDHSVPFGAIRAVSEARPGVGILHIDAHADLREAYEGFTWSHASIMFNVARRIPGIARIVQVGLRDLGVAEERMVRSSAGGIVAFFDADIASRTARGEPFARIAAEIAAALPEEVWVSFDIDGLDPTLCPHTGTPVPGGLGFHQATGILAAVADSGRRIVGGDLCEVAPGPRGDEWDANVGARVLYKMIGFALKSQAAGPAG